MTQPTDSSVQHTPGPWRVMDGVERLVLDDDGHIIAAAESVASGEANARLIAAAPDGLAAAKFALSVLQANPVELSERLAIEKLEAFIAKAEGLHANS